MPKDLVMRRGARAVRLLRNTTWKCGEVERMVVRAILEELEVRPRAGEVPIQNVVRRLERIGISRDRALDALARLQKRRIVELR